jgi:ABC-2 type transport system permease protein
MRALSLTLVHTKYQFLETVRVPIAVVGSVFFPTASMLFFVVPFVGNVPAAATVATGSMMTCAAMRTCLFQFGVGVSDDRAQPWDPYVRTLPVGVAPRLAGRIVTGLGFIVVAVVPVLVIAALFTKAEASPAQIALGIGALVIAAVPFTFLGLAIGYALPTKAALAVANITFFPLAFGGGLLTGPDALPGFVKTISPYLPTRSAVELVWAAISDFPLQRTSLVMLGVWILVFGLAAVWAYRRDEGRRFR